MKLKKDLIQMSEEEQKELEEIIKRGKRSATTVRPAIILFDLAESMGSMDTQKETAVTVAILPIHGHFNSTAAIPY